MSFLKSMASLDLLKLLRTWKIGQALHSLSFQWKLITQVPNSWKLQVQDPNLKIYNKLSVRILSSLTFSMASSDLLKL
jgi:hypothetical protein